MPVVRVAVVVPGNLKEWHDSSIQSRPRLNFEVVSHTAISFTCMTRLDKVLEAESNLIGDKYFHLFETCVHSAIAKLVGFKQMLSLPIYHFFQLAMSPAGQLVGLERILSKEF